MNDGNDKSDIGKMDGDASAPPSIFPISLLSLPSFIFFAKIEFLH